MIKNNPEGSTRNAPEDQWDLVDGSWLLSSAMPSVPQPEFLTEKRNVSTSLELLVWAIQQYESVHQYYPLGGLWMKSLEEQFTFKYSAWLCMQWEGTICISLLTTPVLQPATAGRCVVMLYRDLMKQQWVRECPWLPLSESVVWWTALFQGS